MKIRSIRPNTNTDSVTPHFVSAGVLILQLNFQNEGGSIGSSFLEGVAGKGGVIFFRGNCSFYIKIKLKPEIFNDKKFINKNLFLS